MKQTLPNFHTEFEKTGNVHPAQAMRMAWAAVLPYALWW
jgi:hypothetical protein